MSAAPLEQAGSSAVVRRHPDAPSDAQVNAAVISFAMLANPTRVRML